MSTQIGPESSLPQLTGGLLGPLPVVMHYLRAMKIKEIIDAAVPPDPRGIWYLTGSA